MRNDTDLRNFVVSESDQLAYNSSRHLPENALICYAPFSSLYFNHKGEVSVCCWNHTFPLGIYPNQSIKEMWHGERAAQFRKKILNGDLALGCDKCFSKLKARDYQGIMARSFDRYASMDVTLPTPKRLTFELSNTCNLACEMCWGYYSSKVRSQRDGLPAIPSPYDDRFLEQLEPLWSELTEVLFVGGEPLLIPAYREIMRTIKKQKPQIEVSITTNGTIMSDDIERLLTDMNMSVHLSIDSFFKDTYEKIRKGGNFNDVIKTFERLVSVRNEGRIRMLSVSLCPMRGNISEIPSILEMLNHKEVAVYFNNTIYPTFLSLRPLHARILDPIIRKLNSIEELLSGGLTQNRLQLSGLIQQLEGWSDLNKKIIPYEPEDVRRLISELENSVSVETHSFCHIMSEIHIHTVFHRDDTLAFQLLRNELQLKVRSKDEQLGQAFLDAIQLLAQGIASLCDTNTTIENAITLQQFLSSTPNAYRVLLSFIVRNDIIFMLHTLDEETVMNMKSFAHYDD